MSAEDVRQRKVLFRASYPDGSFLRMMFARKLYTVNEMLQLTYNTLNAPQHGFIYYMVTCDRKHMRVLSCKITLS